MVHQSTERRLAAVLAADVAEYTRLMEQDSVGTVAAWQRARDESIDPAVADYKGRIVKYTGDGFLVEFPTVQDAVECAIRLRDELETSSLRFRMGVSLGDIIDDGQDIHGEGVNIAARLEGLAEPGGLRISGMVFDSVRNRVDAQFVDLGEKEVKHVSQPVRVYALQTGAVPAPGSVPEPTAPSSTADATSIAVLPFKNLSNDPEQDFLSDGITEDLITTLSQVGQLSVSARNSAFAFQGKTAPMKEVGQTLNVDYVVSGSLRKSGDRIRVTAQLTDTRSETNLWAERFDRQIEDLFAVQDEIVLTIATALQVRLTEGEQAKLRYTTTDNVDAWALFTQGLSHFRTVSADTYRQARECFERALSYDPDSAQIHAMLACVLAIDGRFYWTKDRDATLSGAETHARQALELDPNNPDAWGALGYWHMCHCRLKDSVEAYSKAVDLAPRHADLRALFALALTFAERPEDAIREVRTAIKLNPLHPGWYGGILGHALRYGNHLEEAIETLADYHKRHAGFGLVDMVLTYADMDSWEEAQTSARALLEARPEFTIEAWALTQNCSDPDRLARDRASLEKAGLP